MALGDLAGAMGWAEELEDGERARRALAALLEAAVNVVDDDA